MVYQSNCCSESYTLDSINCVHKTIEAYALVDDVLTGSNAVARALCSRALFPLQ